MKFRINVDMDRYGEPCYTWEYENGTQGSLGYFPSEAEAYDDALRTIKRNRDVARRKAELKKKYPKTFTVNEEEL